MITLASVFQNNMILQRDKPVPIWGTGTPGEEIQITVMNGLWKGTVSTAGGWIVNIGPLPATECCRLTVSCAGQEITLENVAAGDVYLAGGQSNMEFLMRYEKHFPQEREQCWNPCIRFFDVPEIAYDGQDRDFDYSNVGFWRTANRENLDYFSAPGYYFAKTLQHELKVPIGIIGLNWGGSRSSAWMSEEHARAICPEQVDDFNGKLKGQSYEELLQQAGQNPMNDRGYRNWNPFEEFILPQTPDQEQLMAFFAQAQDGPDMSAYIEIPDVKSYPGALFEHMVKKTAPFGVKGVLWYHGESDDELDGSADHYEVSLQAIISDWRELWKDDSLPFLVVQLPGFRSWLACVNKNFRTIRNAQQRVADSDANTHLCSISDAGEEYDIHPKDKKIVGDRLALLALRYLYGKDILADAPRPDSVTREGNRITIVFANAGEGLNVLGDAIKALHVLSADAELPFDWCIANATMEIILPESEKHSVELRFAMEAWYSVNLYNSAGIPAIPFLVRC